MQKLEIAQFEEYVFLRIISDRKFFPLELKPLTAFMRDLNHNQLECRGLKELSWVITMPNEKRAWEMTNLLLTIDDNKKLDNVTNPKLDGFQRNFIELPAEGKMKLVYCVPCPPKRLKFNLRKLPQVNLVQLKWPYVVVDFKAAPDKAQRLGPFCKKRIPSVEAANVLGLSSAQNRLLLPF